MVAACSMWHQIMAGYVMGICLRNWGLDEERRNLEWGYPESVFSPRPEGSDRCHEPLLGGANIVNGNSIRGYQAGELQHLVEVPLSWKWKRDDNSLFHGGTLSMSYNIFEPLGDVWLPTVDDSCMTIIVGSVTQCGHNE